MNRKTLKPWILLKLQGKNKMAGNAVTSPIPGRWLINVITENFSEPFRIAFLKLNRANHSEYTPIAQLATQVVAGENIVALAEQIIYHNPIIKNYVSIVFYAKPNTKEFADIEILSITPLPLGCTMVTIPDGQRVYVADIIKEYEKAQQNNNQVTSDEWEKDALLSEWPKDIDDAIDLLNQNYGISYKMIACIGKQVAKGINYAILAEQTIICRQDAKNIVHITFNTFEGKISIYSIEIILEGHTKPIPGGITIEASAKLPKEAQEEFDSVMKLFGGMVVKPFAYLGYQVVNGTNRFLVAEVTPKCMWAKKRISLTTINAMHKTIKFVDIH